jgi:tRNA G10  N-methylase Trm11
MVRMKKHAPFDKILKKGELRPDVVDIMLNEAKINKNSIIIDLFGGWGAIAAAVAGSGNYKKIYTGDIKDECVQYQIKRLKNNKNCFIKKWDARQIPLDDNSVDAIISDPPWGEFEPIDIQTFYNAFIKEAARILRPGGSFVFLSSALDEAKRALENHHFTYSYIPTKINGKNTCLFSAVHDL